MREESVTPSQEPDPAGISILAEAVRHFDQRGRELARMCRRVWNGTAVSRQTQLRQVWKDFLGHGDETPDLDELVRVIESCFAQAVAKHNAGDKRAYGLFLSLLRNPATAQTAASFASPDDAASSVSSPCNGQPYLTTRDALEQAGLSGLYGDE